MAYITVDVCLDEIETPDLVRELRRRGHTVDGKLPPELTETPQMWTNSLAQAGCPKVLLGLLEDWLTGKLSLTEEREISLSVQDIKGVTTGVSRFW